MISKAERAELKTIVKQQYKVLRSEVEQRQYELHEQVEEEIATRFSDDDEQWAAMQHRIYEAVSAANRTINDLLREYGYEADLLRTLAVGAIESEEARAFMASIPTVAELVPAARLAEIEASLVLDEDDE